MAKSNFEVANELNRLPVESRLDLYTKMGIMSQEEGELNKCKNFETYRTILNKNILLFVYLRLKNKEPRVMGIASKYPNMQKEIVKWLKKSPEDKKSYGIKTFVDAQTLLEALSLFDIDEVDSKAEAEDVKSNDFDDDKVNGEDLKDVKGVTEDRVDVKGISEEVLAEIDTLVNSIISVFDMFYAPLVQKKVDGILTDIGCYDVTNKSIVTSTSIACKTLLNGIKNSTKGKLKSAKIGEVISWKLLKEGVTYFPQIVADTLSMKYKYGGKEVHDASWVEYRPHLKELIFSQIKAIILGCGLSDINTEEDASALFDLKNNLRKIYSTAFVVEKFDANSEFEMRLISEDVQNTVGYEQLGEEIAHGSLSRVFSQESSSIEVLANKSIAKNIHKYLFILDNATYTGKLLFAYKGMEEIIKGGGKLGYANTLMGKALDGEQFTINLAAKQNIVTLIAAGSRSGKGVLTMGMCGTLIASAVPLVYLDYKPDMACAFWDLERKKGCKFLAIDAKTGFGDSEPIRKYPFGLNAPEYIVENSEFNDIQSGYRYLPYLRGIQLMMALSYAINAKLIPCESKRVMFVLDEAQVFANELNGFVSKLDEILKPITPKKNQEPTEEYTYINKLSKCMKKMSTQGFLNTTAGKSGVGCIILGQQAEIGQWARTPNDGIYTLVSNCQQKLLGRNAANGSSAYSLGAAAGHVDGETYANEKTGYFAFVPTNKPGKESGKSIKVFKSYMTLNYNDAAPNMSEVETNSGNCVGTLLSNISDPVLRESAIKQLYDSNGNPEPAVGFEGMMEFIAHESGINNIWEMAGMGYEVCQRVTDLLGITGQGGRFSTIEEWMFDCSYENLNSYSDIEMALSKGYKLFDGSYADSTGKEMFIEEEIPDELHERADNIGRVDDKVNTDNLNPNVVSNMEEANIDYSKVKLSSNDIARVNEAKELLFGNQNVNSALDDEVVEFGDEDEEAIDYGAIADKVQQITEDEIEERELINGEADLSQFVNNPSVEFTSDTGRDVIIKPSKDKPIHRCTPDNSIIVSLDDYSVAENRAFKFFKTFEGTDYEFNKRWNAVLNGIAKQMNPLLITRVVIGDDCMYVNKKLIHMSGILGGLEDVRLEDLVEFNKLFKKFPNIKEITITGVIFEAAQIQLGNPFMMMFELGNKLNYIEVISDPNSEPVIVRRKDLNGNSSAKEQASALIKEARFKNQFDAAGASMSNKFERQTPGYRNKVYKVSEVSSKGASKVSGATKASWEHVKKGFKNKKGLSTALWGASLVITGTIGASLWLTGKATKLISGKKK